MTSRAFMVGSFAIDTQQHSNDAREGLLLRDIEQAINDLGRDDAVAVRRLGPSRAVLEIAGLRIAVLGLVGLALVGSCAAALAAPGAPAASPAPRAASAPRTSSTLRMGGMTLSRCSDVPVPGPVYSRPPRTAALIREGSGRRPSVDLLRALSSHRRGQGGGHVGRDRGGPATPRRSPATNIWRCSNRCGACATC